MSDAFQCRVRIRSFARGLCVASVLLSACAAPSPPAAPAGPAVHWRPPSGTLAQVGLQVRVAGEGTPTIVLLHGLAGSHRYFGAAYDVLARDARLVVPDLLGFGGSPRPTDLDYGPDDHAQAVIEALERLDVKPPVYVGAHSMGTLVALRIAALRPDWIRGIVAFGPPLYADETAARAHIGGLGFTVRWFAQDNLLTQWVCRIMCSMRGFASRLAMWLRPDLPGPVARDAVKHTWFSYARTVRHLVYASQPVPLEDLRVPLRLIAGESDPVVDLAHLRRLADRHPNVSLEVWRGGHDLPIRATRRSLHVLREWVVRGSAKGSVATAR